MNYKCVYWEDLVPIVNKKERRKKMRRKNGLFFLSENRIAVNPIHHFLKLWAVCIIVPITLSLLIGCQNHHKPVNHSNCVFFGYDSIIFYKDSRDSLTGVFKGKINDSAFMSEVIKSAKKLSADTSYSVILNPSYAGDIVPNVENVITLLNKNRIRYVIGTK